MVMRRLWHRVLAGRWCPALLSRNHCFSRSGIITLLLLGVGENGVVGSPVAAFVLVLVRGVQRSTLLDVAGDLVGALLVS